MSGNLGNIKVCFLDEPFIFYVDGEFTIENLKVIEDELKEDVDDIYKEYQGKSTVEFSVEYIEKEVQYGTGYGDVFVIPGYYDLDCVSVVDYTEEEIEKELQNELF